MHDSGALVSAFRTEKEKNMGYRNFTPSQILNRAIGKEEQAKTLYEMYAGIVENRQAKMLLEELAKEELGHKLALEKINPEEPGVFSTTEISSGEFGEFFDRPQISKDSPMQDILRFAIAEEADAFNFYSSLAKYTKDDNLINLLNRLAGEEKRHKQRLERIYDDMFQPDN
jgi:rubrerythrin